jgi:hypothetical protein
MKTTALVLILGLSILATGCGPSKAEREAAERERLRMELEEKTRREAEAANKAISEMNQNMFKKLTPEERAARDAERKRNAQKMVDEWKAAEAKQEAATTTEQKEP